MSRSSLEFIGTPGQIFHWIPGEMIVIVRLPRLPRDDAVDELLEHIQQILNTFLDNYQVTLDLYGTSGRWNEMPAMPPIRRRSFVFGLQRKQPLMAIFFHTRQVGQTVLVNDPLPLVLSHIHGHLEYFARLGVHIVSAMPNWLLAAAPFYYHEGGPALPPQAAAIGESEVPVNATSGWHVQFMNTPLPFDPHGAEDVLIAVLDTAPHPDRIRSAATRPELRRNWLLQQLTHDLRQEDGSFFVEYDRYPLTNDVGTGRVAEHDPRYYLMPDHGLSVVGLIRDVAPRAKVRLVRILNDYGGGDLYALFAALTDLEHELATGAIRRLVINLSLTMLPDMRRLPYVWLEDRPWSTRQLMGVVRILNQLEDGLRLLFDSLFMAGALIVAAAGNDSSSTHEQGTDPRPPRAPARYESTLGVSSVNSLFAASKFANAANVASMQSGVATFGGDEEATEDGERDAVRGVYISPIFPLGEQNTSGWADWRGTSFSTAIISGLSAHFMAQGWTAANIMTRLSSAIDARNENGFEMPFDVPALLANVVRVRQLFDF
ncbi:MAG TPA: S8/S53 family peptidase [Dictyobacter sp.]|nr:S8/S53 family peptidase [Dictyobacter sp.]